MMETAISIISTCALYLVHITLCIAGRYENVAFQKPTDQIDTYRPTGSSITGVSTKAVDGVHLQSYYNGSCIHTISKSNTWWMVDLQGDYAIHHITITNRVTFSYRTYGFYIYITSYDPRPITGSYPNDELCLYHPAVLSIDGPQTLYCKDGNAKNVKNMTGRYVTMWKTGAGVLNICEFEVFAEKPRQVVRRLKVLSERRIDETSFTTVDVGKNATNLNCVVACLKHDGGEATSMDFENLTGKCRCFHQLLLDGQPWSRVTAVNSTAIVTVLV